MHDWQSLSHVRWECKYHWAIIPWCRRKVGGWPHGTSERGVCDVNAPDGGYLR
jgi:hypothetical protein